MRLARRRVRARCCARRVRRALAPAVLFAWTQRVCPGLGRRDAERDAAAAAGAGATAPDGAAASAPAQRGACARRRACVCNRAFESYALARRSRAARAGRARRAGNASRWRRRRVAVYAGATPSPRGCARGAARPLLITHETIEGRAPPALTPGCAVRHADRYSPTPRSRLWPPAPALRVVRVVELPSRCRRNVSGVAAPPRVARACGDAGRSLADALPDARRADRVAGVNPAGSAAARAPGGSTPASRVAIVPPPPPPRCHRQGGATTIGAAGPRLCYRARCCWRRRRVWRSSSP